MPTTPNGLPYPASTAAPNVPADIQALALALDLLMKDTGWVNCQTSSSTVPTVQVRQIGRTMWLYMNGPINNLANGASVGYNSIIPAAYRPTIGNIRLPATLDSRPGTVIVGTNGTVTVYNFTGAVRTNVDVTIVPYVLT